MSTYPTYNTNVSDNGLLYEFISHGPNGTIRKLVQFNPIFEDGYEEETYNCGFGDLNVITGELDDKIISNNGDKGTVIATVAETIYDFTANRTNVYLIFRGSNEIRTRWYGKIICNYYDTIVKDFYIFGVMLDTTGVVSIVVFDKADRDRYNAYLVKRR